MDITPSMTTKPMKTYADNKNALWIGLAVAAAVAVVGGGVVLFLLMREDTTDPQKSQTKKRSGLVSHSARQTSQSSQKQPSAKADVLTFEDLGEHSVETANDMF